MACNGRRRFSAPSPYYSSEPGQSPKSAPPANPHRPPPGRTYTPPKKPSGAKYALVALAALSVLATLNAIFTDGEDSSADSPWRRPSLRTPHASALGRAARDPHGFAVQVIDDRLVSVSLEAIAPVLLPQ